MVPLPLEVISGKGSWLNDGRILLASLGKFSSSLHYVLSQEGTLLYQVLLGPGIMTLAVGAAQIYVGYDEYCEAAINPSKIDLSNIRARAQIFSYSGSRIWGAADLDEKAELSSACQSINIASKNVRFVFSGTPVSDGVALLDAYRHFKWLKTGIKRVDYVAGPDDDAYFLINRNWADNGTIISIFSATGALLNEVLFNDVQSCSTLSDGRFAVLEREQAHVFHL